MAKRKGTPSSSATTKSDAAEPEVVETEAAESKGVETMSNDRIPEANKMLLEICSQKANVIKGASNCPTSEDEVAVEPPRLQPCFTLRWGDGKEDRIETEDYEIMCIEATNPYVNVTMEDLTIINLELKYLHEGKEVAVPIAQYTNKSLADLTPSRMIRFGDLGPNSSNNREVVLGTFRTAPGNYKINLECCYSVKFDKTDTDSFTIPIGRS